MTIAGLILAGGRGSRMGGMAPKPLIALAGRPLAEHVADRLRDHCRPVVVNGPMADGLEALGWPLVSDRRSNFSGPLAGLEAGLLFFREQHPTVSAAVIAPADTPFLPRDLVPRLIGLAPTAFPIVATFEGRLQPTVGLWPVETVTRLGAWLDKGRPLALRAFLKEHGYATEEFAPQAAAPHGDPFFNVNTPDDLAAAEAFIAGRTSP